MNIQILFSFCLKLKREKRNIKARVWVRKISLGVDKYKVIHFLIIEPMVYEDQLKFPYGNALIACETHNWHQLHVNVWVRHERRDWIKSCKFLMKSIFRKRAHIRLNLLIAPKLLKYSFIINILSFLSLFCS